jgi:hypothetical protein
VEADTEGPFEPGDRVVAAHDLDTQGLHIPAGTEGTVAEDRGSRLVVSFDDQATAATFEEQDLTSPGEAPPSPDR